MMNIYNGNVVTDGNGDAVVQLPDWFEALNRDFRYQLTVIGQFARAIVASEVSKQRFTIKTDQPNVKVSWQVTAFGKTHGQMLIASRWKFPRQRLSGDSTSIRNFSAPHLRSPSRWRVIR
jgi:hypothetical protein